MLSRIYCSPTNADYASSAPSGWSSPPQSIDTYGHLGLGPTSGSQLVKDAKDGSHSLIDQVLMQESSNKYMTLLVSPLESDKGNPITFSGFFSVGSTVDLTNIFGVSADKLSAADVPVLSKVTSQPKLQIGTANTFPIDDIQVAGKGLGLTSTVSSSKKPLVTLSTTSPWIVVPKSVVDAVYANVPGASYSSSDRLYHLPCTAEVQVTFVIAGVSYPMSPLDVIATQAGSSQCVGTVSCTTFDSSCSRSDMGYPPFSSKRAMVLFQATCSWVFHSVRFRSIFVYLRLLVSPIVHFCPVTSPRICFLT